MILDHNNIKEEQVRGRTVMIPKSYEISKSENYRPITILNSTYKLFTKIIQNRMVKVYEGKLTLNQKAAKGRYGVKEGILYTQGIEKDMKNRGITPVIVYLDITKAFDSLSHESIIEILKLDNVPKYLIKVIKQLMVN